MKPVKKRWIKPEERQALREHGITSLGISDFDKLDPGVRARAISAGAEGTRQKWDGQRVVKRARILLAEQAARVPPSVPDRRNLREWSLDDLLEGTTPSKRPQKVTFRDIDHEEETSEVADLLELMAGATLGDDPVTLDLAGIVDREQACIEAALAGLGDGLSRDAGARIKLESLRK